MDYLSLLEKLQCYKNDYKVFSIGKTYFGRDIYVVEKESGADFPTAFLMAGIHAREHITTDLICKMIDEKLFDEIKDFNVVFVPMANPDGVELCYGGVMSVPKQYRKNLIEINGGSKDFSLWKANGRGVDLNNNFDARFGTNVGSFYPASQGYVGEIFESESETKVIVDFTKNVLPFITISYHSKGEEIYFNFFQTGKRLERDKLIAEKFAESTGYVIKNPESVSSGGYKDWCVDKLKIPALTIEVGSDELSHPIGLNHLDEIFDKHKNIAKDLSFAYNVVREKNYV